MPTVILRFPGGRYHATPWGHHVNEGLIEWPPCPWRLLRAFIARGFSSQTWCEVPLVAYQLITTLAGVLPVYRLPPASAAHSRHFMPLGELTKGREKTTLVFDTWADIGRDELLIHWPCELNDEEATLFSELARSLGYLGRSESWVEAQVVSDTDIAPADLNSSPCLDGEHRDREWEQVSLMAAVPPEEYRIWREREAKTAQEPYPLPQGKKKPSKKLFEDREKAVEPFPEDLVCCLTKDTAWWKGHGWSQPPGSQRVLYWRPIDSLQVSPPRSVQRPFARTVTSVLLSLSTPSGNRSSLPHVNRTLPQAELLHRALIARLSREAVVDCPELTGRDGEGKPLELGHRHAHVLPLDLDSDLHLDHILIYAPMGLGSGAQRAIRTLRRTWSKGGIGELQLAVAGVGSLDDLRRLPSTLGGRIGKVLGPRHGATVWESETPFVPPRFLKSRGRNSLLGQIDNELNSRGLPAVRSLAVLPWQSGTLHLRHYVLTRRRGGEPPPVDCGYALRLELSEPIVGPLALGYGSHFGLGLFQAVTPS